MLAGFNEDIVIEGLTYHVQSEDRGVANPLLETLIYTGGRILDQVRSSYEDLVEDGRVDEKKLIVLLERQHKDVLRRVRHGAFAPDGQRTLSDLLLDERSLEQELVRFLESDEEVELLRLVWKPSRSSPKVRGILHVRLDADESPVDGAMVTMAAVRPDGTMETLAECESGVDGTAMIRLDVPFAGLVALIFRAERGPGGGRLRVPLSAPRAPIGEQRVTSVGS